MVNSLRPPKRPTILALATLSLCIPVSGTCYELRGLLLLMMCVLLAF
ncbi:Uncharacterised protein [Salmonella enterica subsp. enterica serovar Havana]|nr:hypothetical protein [Salmonella enterica]VEB48745.1 Uncharacterised protein [Salmonella enterica subsp. enterica serovar Havana]